jgi:hypothetical protein
MITVVVPMATFEKTFEGVKELEFNSNFDYRETWDLRFKDKFGRTVVVKGPYVVYEQKDGGVSA